MSTPRMQVSPKFAELQSPELVLVTNAWMREFFGVEGPHGFCDGDTCCRNHCTGIIDIHPSDNCSCHLSPPCSSCTAPRNFCPDCGWEEVDDPETYRTTINDYVVNIDRSTGNYRSWEPRPLDPTRIDYRNLPHTNASMIKEGIFPEGVTTEQLRSELVGTFGGRFEYLDQPHDGKPGRFKYIAYTD